MLAGAAIARDIVLKTGITGTGYWPVRIILQTSKLRQ